MSDDADTGGTPRGRGASARFRHHRVSDWAAADTTQPTARRPRRDPTQRLHPVDESVDAGATAPGSPHGSGSGDGHATDDAVTGPGLDAAGDREAGTALGRAGRAGARRLTGSVRSLFDTGGRGFRQLALTQVFSTLCDTLVAIGLAGTLFFSVPSAEARGNVALYLLLTVAPFAIIGPTLGRVLDRTPIAIRTMLVAAAVGRAALAVLALGRLDSLWLFPVAFGLLVLSRVHGITRNSLLPLALDRPRALVAANARLAWIAVLAGGVAAGLGFPALAVFDANGPLALAALAALGAGFFGRKLPEPDSAVVRHSSPGIHVRLHLPRNVRMAQLATAGVRAFNGFLLLLIAFEFQRAQAGLLDFGALLAAAGAGFAIASRLVPWLERRVPEEPMVVGALALTAGAAFATSQWFGLVAAGALAGLAGVAWGVAKLAFDGLLQSTVPASRRGAAFTRSETVFSVAWVLGAIVPTAIPMPASLGLALAGLGALAAQIVYVGALLVPPPGTRRRPDEVADAEGDLPRADDGDASARFRVRRPRRHLRRDRGTSRGEHDPDASRTGPSGPAV